MSDCPEFQNLIGGQMRGAESGALIDSIDPQAGRCGREFHGAIATMPTLL